MWRLFVALRYLKRRLTTYIATAGVTIGVMVLVIVVSVMGGFQREFHEKLRGINAHITVESYDFSIQDAETLMNAIRRVKGVAAVAPFVQNIVLVKGMYVDFGFIKGIEPDMEAEVGKLRQYLLRSEEALAVVEYENTRDHLKAYEYGIAQIKREMEAFEEGSARRRFAEFALIRFKSQYEELSRKLERLKEPYQKALNRAPFSDEEIIRLFCFRKGETPGVVVGIELMKHYNLRVGDEILLMTATRMNLEKIQQEKFVVLGAFKTGVFDTDFRYLYGLVDEVKKFIGVEGIGGISVKLEDFKDAERLKDAIQVAIEPFEKESSRLSVKTWMELNRTLLQAVQMEKWLLSFIIFFIVVVAGFGIVSILTMMVAEKTRDIGILKSLGGTTKGVMGVFLIAGTFIAAAGSALGLSLGLTFVYRINEVAAFIEKLTGYHPFPRDVYYLDKIPTEVDALELAYVVVPTLLLSFVFALYPAIRASRLHPVEALRYE
ncbi:MAG: ABC transporter permease [Planctomycetota bacterium]|nr:ABC transporter permease [Planctomycetota bacterium]